MFESKLFLKSLLIDLQALKDKVSLLLDDTCPCVPTELSVVSAVNSICGAGYISLEVSADPGCAYQWQIYQNGTWESITGATGATYTALLYTAGTYSYRLVVSSGQCISATEQVDIVVYASDFLQVYASLEDSDVCSGGTASLFAEVIGDDTGTKTYQWQRSTDDLTWEDILDSNSASYADSPLLVGDTDPTSYYYRAIVVGESCGAVSGSVQITVTADPIVTLTVEDDVICVGGQFIFHANVVGGAGSNFYSWRHWDTDHWEDIPGEEGADLYTSGWAMGEHTFSVYVRQDSGCEDVDQVTVEVIAVPTITIDIPVVELFPTDTLLMTAAYLGGDYSTGGAAVVWEIYEGSFNEMFGVTGLSPSVDLSTFILPILGTTVVPGDYPIRAHLVGDSGCEAYSNIVYVTIKEP